MRSKYIYLIYSESSSGIGCQLLSAHTVKYEAHRWLEKSEWDTRTALLYRMRDGSEVSMAHSRCDMKPLSMVNWDHKLFDLDSLDPLDRNGIVATSAMADWPDWAKGLL